MLWLAASCAGPTPRSNARRRGIWILEQWLDGAVTTSVVRAVQAELDDHVSSDVHAIVGLMSLVYARQSRALCYVVLTLSEVLDDQTSAGIVREHMPSPPRLRKRHHDTSR